MDYETEILYIAGEEHCSKWVELQPHVYYKDGKPYGLIGTVISDSITYIASTTTHVDNGFTIGMIRDIIRLYNNSTICLITESKDHQDLIRRSLSRFKFEFEDRNGVLYSINKG